MDSPAEAPILLKRLDPPVHQLHENSSQPVPIVQFSTSAASESLPIYSSPSPSKLTSNSVAAEDYPSQSYHDDEEEHLIEDPMGRRRALNANYFKLFKGSSSSKSSNSDPKSGRKLFFLFIPLQFIIIFFWYALYQVPWKQSIPKYGGLCAGKGAEYCERYGAHNIKLSRAYEGTALRLRRVLRRARLEGRPLNVAVLGGSVSVGHGLTHIDQNWVSQVFAFLNATIPNADSTYVNAAIPAFGSGYFALCWQNHINKDTVDLVFTEHGINDQYNDSAGRQFEYELRGILGLPQQPAVINVVTAGLGYELLAVGSDIQIAIAEYYDVPTINIRPLLLPHVLKHPDVAPDYWDVHDGDVDMRHINFHGHKVLADMVNAYLTEQISVIDNNFDWLSKRRRRKLNTVAKWEKKRNAYGWPTVEESMNTLPPLRIFNHFNPRPEPHLISPQCWSMAQGATQVLTTSYNDGWFSLTPSQTPDKTYLASAVPGSKFAVTVDVVEGVVQLYYLRADKFGTGSVNCWVERALGFPGYGGGEEHKVRLDGWWDSTHSHIAVFDVVAEGLSRGKHELVCELLSESKDPNGGLEFRVVSVVGL